MRFLGNLVWIIFGGGLILFLFYLLGGVVMCITIVGIPFGIQAFKLSTLALVPFGKEIVTKEKPSGFVALLMNIIWILLPGLEIAITHFVFGLVMAITIVGIPFAKQHIKLAALALLPFGHEVRPIE